MKNLIWVILCNIYFWANAQNSATITQVPDTSFNTLSAFRQTLKTHPEAEIVGEFRFSNVKEIREIVYHSIDKRNLLLDAFYPIENANGISILIIHGGGWRSGNRLQHVPLAQKLASLGYNCFTVEYRLSTEALFPAAVMDLKNAINWIKSNTHLFGQNSEKIVVCGFSAGGQLAALLSTTGNKNVFEDSLDLKVDSKVAALINIDGILAFIHPESGEGDDSKETSAATQWFGYSKTQNPQIWKKASALTWVNHESPPTLFLNSSEDRMHAGKDAFTEVLKKYSIYFEVKTYENTPHSFVLFEPWFSPTVEAIDKFLKKVI